MVHIMLAKNQLGARLEQVRKLHGLTQKQLAALTNVSLRSVVAAESIHGNPTITTLTKLFDALGMEMVAQPKSQ